MEIEVPPRAKRGYVSITTFAESNGRIRAIVCGPRLPTAVYETVAVTVWPVVPCPAVAMYKDTLYITVAAAVMEMVSGVLTPIYWALLKMIGAAPRTTTPGEPLLPDTPVPTYKTSVSRVYHRTPTGT